MDLLMTSGDIYANIDIDIDRIYTYDEIKQVFLNINVEHHYCILQDGEKIFTDLYDLIFNKIHSLNINNSENFMNIRIPMVKNNRSMNLSNSVAVILYEAWRQNNFNKGI